MRTPAALPRLALGPLLLATALGPVGFAAGWLFRPGADAPPAAAPPPSRADGPADGGAARSVSSVRLQSQTGAPEVKPTQPTPRQARERLTAWVAAGCPRGDPREVLELLAAWSETAPWEALAFLHGAPRFRGRTEAYAIPLARIGQAAPAEAAAWIERELPDPTIREAVIGNLIRHLLPDHPGSALEIARNGDARTCYLAARAFERLAERDPATALAWFDQRFTPDERAYHASALAAGWLRLDAPAAQSWCLEQAGKPHGEVVLRGLAAHLAETSPEDLGALFAAPEYSTAARVAILHEIGDSRPEIALELLPTLPSADARGVFLGLFDSLFSEDPAAAVELGRSLLPEELLLNRVRASWHRWNQSDQPAAQAWAATVVDASVHHELELDQARQAIRQAPDAFLASVNTVPRDAGTRDLVALALATYAHRSPAEAADWFTAHIDAADATFAGTIAEAYAYRSAAEAVAWARGLPAGPARDAAHAALIQHKTQRGEPSGLDVLLTEINDPVIQTQATYRVFSAMSDRDAAERWLETQPLPAEVRASWAAIAGTEDVAVIMQCGGYPYE